MNVFRCTPDRSLDREFLRTCAIYRLLKRGYINRDEAKQIARRRVRGCHTKPERLDGTIEIWLNGPLRELGL